jgi:dephospho-CoA kinase
LKLIGFVGMPGSGKTVASDVAREMGLKVVIMGDVIRQEAARLGLDPTDENLGRAGNMLRAREGPQAVARRTLEMAQALRDDIVVIDGLRSKAEADFFRANANEFLLIEIWTPPEVRLKRIVARGRPDDANSENSAVALQSRDSRELGWGMSEAIREADMRISNDGNLEDLKKSVMEILEKF